MQVEFYTDGACLHNGKPDAKMGIGIVGICEGKVKEWSIPQDGSIHTNQRAEMLAVCLALKQLPYFADYDVTIYTDSEYAIKCYDGRFQPLKNRDVLAEIRELAMQCKSFKMEKLKGHSGHPENDRADFLADQAARGYCNVYERKSGKR